MKKSYTLFVGLVLIAASLVFTGCQNFLSGNNLKKELEAKIQYEKKPAYTISVELEKAEYGQCNLNTFELKEGESKALTFTLASGYNFKGWKCNDPEAIEFSPADSVKTTVTLKKGKTDLIITPVCAEVFGVKNILPEKKDGGVPCDSPIILTFSHSIKPESLGTAGEDYKISITSDSGDDLSEFYGAPVFSENNTVVKFPAIREKPVVSAGTLNIEVIVKAGIESEVGETIADEYSYKFKVNSSRDSDAPLFINFKVTSKKPSFNQTLETLSEEYDSFKDKIKIDGETLITEIPESSSYEVSEQFHIKDKLYIYCKAEDKGSGAYRLECDSISFPTAESGKKFVLTSENIYEIDDCEIDLSSYPDGEIELTFKLYDYCDNECPDTKVYKVIKDTVIEQDGVRIENAFPNSTGVFVPAITFYPLHDGHTTDLNRNQYRSYGEANGQLYYELEDFDNFYKKISIGNIDGDDWGKITNLTEKNINLVYNIKNVENKAAYDANLCCFIIEKFDEAEDLLLKLVVTDSVGNSYEVEKYYPCGGLSVSQSVNSDYVELSASKNNRNNASEVFYRHFYEFTWNADTESVFNNTVKSSVQKIIDYSRDYSNENWVYRLDADSWSENAAKKVLSLGGLEENKKYVVSFGNGENAGDLYGIGPWYDDFKPSSYEIPVEKFTRPSGMPKESDSLQLVGNNIDTSVPLVCYTVPIYKYIENGNESFIYGKPVKKSIVLSESAYNEAYTGTFEISEAKSSGVNTGTCDATFNNVVIKDSTGKDCTSDFSFEYYYKNSTSTSSFVNKTIKIASVAEETEITVGFIATNIKDSSIIVKAEKTLTVQPVDNYPPVWNDKYYYATYNLYDNDRTGKNFYMNLQAFSCNSSLVYSNLDYMLDDENGYGSVPLFSQTGNFEYEYYWVPADGVDSLPAVEEGSFTPIQSGKSYIEWKMPLAGERDKTSYKLWVPVYDMPDGCYYLVTKIIDECGNYVLKANLLHDLNTFMEKPILTVIDNKLTAKLVLFGQGRYNRTSLSDAFLGVQYLDNKSEWKDINLDTRMKCYNTGDKSNNFYFDSSDYIKNDAIDVSAASGRFIKCGVQAFYTPGSVDLNRDRMGRYYAGMPYGKDSFSYEINSVPVYKYIGDETSTYFKLIEKDNEIVIYSDGPVFSHVVYSTNEEGYGDNIDEWERRGRELYLEKWNYVYSPKVMTGGGNDSFYKGYILEALPSDAKSYVVIAYSANGEKVISSVYKNNQN